MESSLLQVILIGTVAVLVCTAHLGVGFLVGLRFREVPLAVENPLAAHTLTLVRQSFELNEHLREHIAELPERVAVAAAKLIQAAQNVNDQLPTASQVANLSSALPPPRIPNANRCLPPVPVAPPLSPSPFVAAPAALSSLEFNDFITSSVDNADGSSRPAERRSYRTRQFVGYIRDGLPTAHAFDEVMCHDISMSGISFFQHHAPVLAELVILLGTAPQLSFMLAKVVHCRAAFVEGREMYRVGCQFLRRLTDNEYRLNEFSGAIESGRPNSASAVVCSEV